jgi:hypothetical protein
MHLGSLAECNPATHCHSFGRHSVASHATDRSHTRHIQMDKTNGHRPWPRENPTPLLAPLIPRGCYPSPDKLRSRYHPLLCSTPSTTLSGRTAILELAHQNLRRISLAAGSPALYIFDSEIPNGTKNGTHFQLQGRYLQSGRYKPTVSALCIATGHSGIAPAGITK